MEVIPCTMTASVSSLSFFLSTKHVMEIPSCTVKTTAIIWNMAVQWGYHLKYLYYRKFRLVGKTMTRYRYTEFAIRMPRSIFILLYLRDLV